jgi:hypothetical protein
MFIVLFVSNKGAIFPIIKKTFVRQVYSTSHIHTYHSRFIPEGVAETSEIDCDQTVPPVTTAVFLIARKRDVLFYSFVSNTTLQF